MKLYAIVPRGKNKDIRATPWKYRNGSFHPRSISPCARVKLQSVKAAFGPLFCLPSYMLLNYNGLFSVSVCKVWCILSI